MLALLLLVQLRLSSRNRAAVLSHVGEDMNPPSVMQSIAHLFDADVPVEDDDDNHSYNAHHDHIDGDDDDDDHDGRGSCKVTWDKGGGCSRVWANGNTEYYVPEIAQSMSSSFFSKRSVFGQRQRKRHPLEGDETRNQKNGRDKSGRPMV